MEIWINRTATSGEALTGKGRMSDWRPISEYPHDGEDGGWGDEALLLVPGEFGPYRLIGWLEAGMWLARAPCDPVCCEDIATPTHFIPITAPAEPPSPST